MAAPPFDFLDHVGRHCRIISFELTTELAG